MRPAELCHTYRASQGYKAGSCLSPQPLKQRKWGAEKGLAEEGRVMCSSGILAMALQESIAG